MIEKAATAVVGMGVEVGYGGYWTPFTELQRRELEQQAMIYKYLVAGLQVPPDLFTPIQRGVEELHAHIFNHPAWTYYSYYGKKFDPEPGRCRRTDGKKWRCSKDAHPDSKYCERHMHRGRNRSRKPVESQPTSQSLLAAIPHSSTGCGSNGGSSQQMPPCSVANLERSSFGSNLTKLQMGPISYGNENAEFCSSQDTSGRVGSLGVGSSPGSGAWSMTASEASSSSLFNQGSNSWLLESSSVQQFMPHSFEPINASSSKQLQQGLHGSDISSPATLKHEQHLVHIFFNEWPTSKESWPNLGSNQNAFSSTQLSISTPRASSDFASGTAYDA